MLDSGVTAKTLIAGLKDEIDIARDIDDSVYIEIISALEQLLYSEIVREQVKTCENTKNIRFEDIYTVYADDTQLIKTNLASSEVFPNIWFKDEEGKLAYKTDFTPKNVTVIYFIRPKIKTSGDENVMVPYEFLDMVRAKVRGEIYKIVNEDGLAAKWLNDYNVLLETFKVWVQNKSSVFGM